MKSATIRGIVVCSFFWVPVICLGASYSGGTGTANDPYQISTPADLDLLGQTYPDWHDKYFVMTNNIDLQAYTGSSFHIIGGYVASVSRLVKFSGFFDGNGYEIQNYTYDSTTSDQTYIGLFGVVSGGIIKNVTVVNPQIFVTSGDSDSGCLVGSLNGGMLENCHIIGGTIETDAAFVYLGGLSGKNYLGKIHNCSSGARVDASLDYGTAGGLVYVNWGTISNSFCTGDVEGNWEPGGLAGSNTSSGIITSCWTDNNVSGEDHVGGIVGENNGQISFSYSLGSVSGLDDIGGIAGRNLGGIINCYSQASVAGGESVGGITGLIWDTGTTGDTFLENCYSTGRVTGSYRGGVVGYYISGDVTDCFWDTQTSLISYSAGGTPKTTAQMYQQATFVNWDFLSPVWMINEGTDYPRLSAQTPPADFGGGSGTINNPYLIYTAEQMDEIGQKPYTWHEHFKLMNDIDMEPYNGLDPNPVFNKIGYSWTAPYKAFSGTFNGNDHTISNFRYTPSSDSIIGLFGAVGGEDSEIRNLTLDNPYVSLANPHQQVGCLAGVLRNGCIRNCRVNNGTSIGDYLTGGLVGRIVEGTLADCAFSGTVSGESDTGGLTGDNDLGTITRCTVDADVVSKAGSYGTGGLVGTNGFGTIKDCRTSGTVTGNLFVGGLVGSNPYEPGGQMRFGHIYFCASEADVLGTDYVGGLLGSNSGEINNCYASGIVEGTNNIGGLAGSNGNTVLNSYSTGQVIGVGNVGGLFGAGYISNLDTACFWDTQTSQTTDGVGNLNPDPSEITGLQTSAMKTRATFTAAGWDFAGEDLNGENNIWRMCIDGVAYPLQSWEFAQNGDFACGEGANLVDLQVLAESWLLSDQIDPVIFNYACDANGDGLINLEDYAALSNVW